MDVNSREQRLRKEAELQSRSGHLANLREREASYIQAAAVVPELLHNQINEVRHEIQRVERELQALQDNSMELPGRRLYWEGFAAESAGELSKALKLYKDASRYAYADAGPAIRSVRYRMKSPRGRATTGSSVWTSVPTQSTRNRLLIGLILFLILVLLVAFVITGYLPSRSERAAGETVTATPTSPPTPPAVILIVPDTSTPTVTDTSTPTPTVAPSRRLASATSLPTETSIPTIVVTLRPAPRVLEPKNGLTWGDGAVVFEFEQLNLAYDELYCVNTLRGFDKTNTENWSYPAVGSKEPRIPIEANVFRVARSQGMKCIVWTAGIGKGSCENLVSQLSDERMIGLPQPCKFR